MNANLFSRFLEAAPADRSTTLIEQPGAAPLSWQDMLDASGRLATLMGHLGLEPGDRVTVQVAKSPEAVWLYLACLRGGFVFHPLNEAYREEELAFLLDDAAPALAICAPVRETVFRRLAPDGCRILTLGSAGEGSLMAAAAEQVPEQGIVQRDAQDMAALLYTSGTTGQPKGAMISHGNLATNAAALVDVWGFSAADRLLHALPIYHAHGLFVGLGCVLMSGARIIFLPRFDTDAVLDALPAATVMMGVPTYYNRLLRNTAFSRGACAGMRLFISGSAPLSPETFAAFRERSGHTVLERYGMTETGMNTSNPLAGERRPGSVGHPLPGVSLRIAGPDDRPLPPGETGEIQLRGPNVFAGYWGLPDKTAEAFTADGFFRSGDQAILDADGYVHIVGRSKDMVISGGLNVYPREVEILLDGLPGVAESAVIGVSHPDLGEAVVAVVAVADGDRPDEARIIAALKERLAGFKVPKRVIVRPTLPRNTMGKLEKNLLRQEHAELFS